MEDILMGIGVGSGGTGSELTYNKSGSPKCVGSSDFYKKDVGSPKLGGSSSTVESYEDYKDAKPEDVEKRKLYPRLDSHVIKHRLIGDYVVVQAKYPQCPNYEGIKIIVYEASGYQEMNKSKLEPHFLKDNPIVARFHPTPKGWNMAVLFCHQMTIAAQTRPVKYHVW